MKYFFICGLLLIHSVSHGQKKYGVIRFYAFCSEQVHGNIPVDKDGNELSNGPDTLYRVYAETKKSNIPVHWKFAWVNGNTYALITKLIEQPVLEIGINKTNNEKIIIKPSVEFFLWSIQLLPAEKIPAPQKIKPGEILLQGTYANKKIVQKTGTLVMLQLPPNQ
jgi:hypothetical protein